MPITRTPWIDDDGSGTTGTIINNAEKTALYNQIDATAAFINAANTFQQPQLISTAGSSMLRLFDSSVPVDARNVRLFNGGQNFLIESLNDANSAVVGRCFMTRAGDWQVGRDVYEKGRLFPMGHPQTVAYSAAHYTASAGMTWTVEAADLAINKYTLIGQTLIWTVQIINASVSGTLGPDLYIACPVPTVSGVGASSFCVDGGLAITAQIGHMDGIKVRVTRAAGGNWSAGTNNMYLYFSGIFFLA